MKKLLKQSIINEFDEPDETINLDAWHKDIEILIYYPIPEENIFDTSLITCGMYSESLVVNKANKAMPAEFLFEHTNSILPKEQLIKTLEEFLLSILSSQDLIKPYTIVYYKNFVTLNSEFTHLIFVPNQGLEYLEVGSALIKVLRIIPLSQEESTTLQNLPDKLKHILINKSNINYRNTNRNTVQNLIYHFINDIWNDIVEWYKVQVPHFYNELVEQNKPTVSLEKLSEIFSIKISEDFISFLGLNNGFRLFDSYIFLSRESILSTWKKMNHLKSENPAITWDKYWIPFAEDSVGNQICIDAGKDQKSFFDHKVFYLEDVQGVVYTNFTFLEWLLTYKEDLYGHNLRVNQEGFIERG